MNQERLMTILVAPIISEKSTMIADKYEQVAFKVLPSASKPEVKAAVELMFKVAVQSVSILNIKGKKKRFGQTTGRRSDVRKAYVALKPGQNIDFQAEVK